MLWTKEFSGAVIRAELLNKHGLLHVVAREGMKKPSGVKKEDWPKKRYLVRQDGAVLWEGDARSTTLLAEDPFPVILGIEGKSVYLEAIDLKGGQVWRRELQEGFPVSTLADPAGSRIFLVQLPFAWMEAMDKPFPAKMAAVDLSNGGTLWVAELEALQGGLGGFGGDFSLSGGTLWWAGGRRAAAADPSGGRIHWQAPIEGDFKDSRHWAFGKELAFVSNGNAVWALSAGNGLLWKKTPPEGAEVHGLFWDSGRLACASLDDKELHMELLDAANGKVLWTRSFRHKKKKMGNPPAGMAFSQDLLALAAGGKIFGLRASSGETAYERPVKSKIFGQWKRLTHHKNHFVLSGPEGAYAYTLDSGEPLWENSDFIDPIYEQRKIRQATVQLGLSGLYFHEAPGAQEAWKQYRSGSRSYSDAAITAASAQYSHNVIQDAKLRQSAAGISESMTGLIEIDLALVNRALGERYGAFYRHRGMKLGALKASENVDAALVDMESGQLTEIGLQKTASACLPQFLIDPVNRRVYQAIRQMALMCKDENKLIAYRY
ncbi:MAG: hypothetical protein A3A86_04565 [Elusimicrobia bacterium RIFCSPLOWO2_01_FULL_60_11]|nr:MAG: hypothetical protein A3A86_04565 [Elusimicrobia bacterium RIFCSPLOWO2_01_FULL_60_11]